MNGEGSVARRRSIATPAELRARIARLPNVHPVTDRFSAIWLRPGPDGQRRPGQKEKRKVWWKDQREHWLGWLGEYDGPGFYGRSNWNRSAQYVYEHIGNPKMLVYLVEASGLDRALVDAATRAALDKESSTMAAMCEAIRRVVPWATIEAALLGL